MKVVKKAQNWINKRYYPEKILRTEGIPWGEHLNDPGEVHTAGRGIIDSFCRIKPMTYDEIETLRDASPEWKEDLRHEYHYYWAYFWLPRVLVAIVVIIGILSQYWGHLEDLILKLGPILFGW